MNVILRRRRLGKTSTEAIATIAGMQVIRNWADSFPTNISYVFRWGTISPVPHNSKVVNSASAVSWCSNKKQGRMDMQAAGVPVPATFDTLNTWARGRVRERKYVLRPRTHAQGRNLCVVSTLGEMADFVEQHPDFYISELINKVSEHRVFVCQGRVVWVAQKTPGNPEDVAWNVARGGRFDNVRWGDWSMPVIEAAIAAAKVSGTDFCGVDVMSDAEGNPYVLEVNSAPSQTSPYRQSCVAKAFSFIVRNGKDTIPVENYNNWKSVIHPALREESNA